MQTIAIISQKGGAGKTTLAVHLAVASAEAGLNTAIIDLDPQASSANWGDRRAAPLPVVISAHSSRLAQEMDRVRELGGQRLYLDTAPHSDAVALAAARAAELVVIPCKPNILDIEAAGTTIELIKTTRTPLFVVLNGVAPFGAEADEAEAAIREMYGVSVCSARLTTRVAFARSLAFGQVAQEFEPEGKARQEVETLHTFMSNALNSRTPSHIQPQIHEVKHDTAEQVRRSAEIA